MHELQQLLLGAHLEDVLLGGPDGEPGGGGDGHGGARVPVDPEVLDVQVFEEGLGRDLLLHLLRLLRLDLAECVPLLRALPRQVLHSYFAHLHQRQHRRRRVCQRQSSRPRSECASSSPQASGF